jgi:hypothetical protein
MDANALHPEPTSVDPGGTWEEDDAPRSSLRSAAWTGVKAGFRWASYIAGPFAAMLLIPGLALMAFGIGIGHGFGVPDFVPGALGFYLVCAAWGVLLGGAIGWIGALIGRGRQGASRPSWWAAANRPIRLFRRRPALSSPGSVAPPGSFRRNWPLLIGIPFQLLIIGAFAAGAYLAWTVAHRLEAATAAADEDDPNWRLDDLLARREPVPYAKNAAVVVAEALELLPEGWPVGPVPPAGSLMPPPSEASRAIERLGAMKDNVRPDEATAAAIRAELEKYREAIQIARSLRYYDRGRHEVEIGPTVIDTPLPETQATRTMARLLTADASMRAYDGDFDGALDSCRASFVSGRSIGDEPFMISQLVRYAIGMVSMSSARRVLAKGEASDPALARMQALVLDELYEPLLLVAIRGERAEFIEMVRRIRDGEIPISALSDKRTALDPGGFRSRIAPWGKLMFDNQMAIGLEWLNEAVSIAGHPAAERPALWQDWEAELHRVKGLWHTPYSATLPVLMMPALQSGSAAYSRYEGELGAMAILLAAERHRLKTGAWPESPAAIDGDILPDPPADPFSGDDYRMEHRDGRLFIYSIGPNGRDEHGAYDPKIMAKGHHDDVGAIGWDVDRRGQAAPARDEGTP